MDGNRSAGYPSNASSGPLPAYTIPFEAAQQNVESDGVSTQKHQRPGESLNSPQSIHRTKEEPEQQHTNPLAEKTKPAAAPNISFKTEPGQLKPESFPTELAGQDNSSVTETEQTVIKLGHQPNPNYPIKLDPDPTEQPDPRVEKLKAKGHQPEPDQTSTTKLEQKKAKLEQAPRLSENHQTQESPTQPTAQNRFSATTAVQHQGQGPSSHPTTRLASPSAATALASVVCPSTGVLPGPPLTIEVFCDQNMCPPPPGSSLGEPKLCGFLQKQGGPLKAWKQRWFTYEENKNQLFYYRTPQDVTPLGWVDLTSATFTFPLRAESGTFHIKTPERTFILKAVTQELMLYWLQQLQVRRWQHRLVPTCPDTMNHSTADNFLPVLKSPLGLVGEGAATVPSTQMLFANMSLKHPLIELQNSLHSLRRFSQEGQSVFHVDAPTWISLNSGNANNMAASSTPPEPLGTPTSLPLADPAAQVSAAGGESPLLFDNQSRKSKLRSSFTMPTLREDSQSSRLQQEKRMLMEDVKAQKKLVWILHKALEAAQLEKRTCAEFLAEKGEQERLELLRHRERQVANLQGQLEESRMETETLRSSLTQRDGHIVELQENIQLLMEKNKAKREVIIKLSDQLSACLSDPQRCGSSSSRALDPQTFRQLQREAENLKCAYLEAANCQAESRYLSILRKLQEAKTLDPVQQLTVQKIIKDALKGELKSAVKFSPSSGHDEYGFKIIPDYEVEDMKLLAKIQALEIRSHNLLHQDGVERPLLSRWAQYLAGRSDDDLCASPELKALLRGGVPQEYRQRLWRWMVRARTRTSRERHPLRYQQLCDKSHTSPHSASRQIELDLHRTLTTNQHFSSPSSPALQQLRRVLLAFSWQSPAIGYCQGLNRLAAIALLILQSEEDAFWCLVAVVETIMPQDYYTKSLVASQVDQQVLKDFLTEKLPRLAAHFEDHNIDVSLITFNWFLVVFVESLPSDILLPLWDAFLYEGTKVIFRYALALFKYKEDDFLKIHDSVEIYHYLRFFTKTVSDSRKLTNIAFYDMNPFPGRLLKNRRALHLERLQRDLRELEEQQKEFMTESSQRKDKELDGLVSEDDDEI
ncbi:TBC1 domain family member 2A isoform X2 [Betta splendens]|uniref:TBC1 domain family member 2A isoform X2 n=1 Tax=Betta splendens TaxID=158456 RepID=A0A9W2Y3F7_BETSP|nr:TBC1 domain family member 2A isoform X2 [Betta splendens]